MPYFPTAAMDRSLVPRSFIFFCGEKLCAVKAPGVFVKSYSVTDAELSRQQPS